MVAKRNQTVPMLSPLIIIFRNTVTKCKKIYEFLLKCNKVCAQPAISDWRAPRQVRTVVRQLFLVLYKRKILTGILWWRGPTAVDEGVRRRSVTLVGLWETVTLCHTLLALEVCMWDTNKTVSERDAKPINLTLGSACVCECAWQVRDVELWGGQNSLLCS